MASIITMSNPSINHTTLTRFVDTPPYSIEQVSILNKNQQSLSISSTPKVSTPFLKTGFTTCSASSALAHLWRDIQGSNNWEGLVQPLHPLLRQELIRYGVFLTACYKAFDLDPNSKRYLNCKYGKNTVLKEVGLGHSGYQVTKYIYATPSNNTAHTGRWIGYIAVSSDTESKRIGRRDVIVTFRGTVTNHEWLTTLVTTLTPAKLDPNNSRPEVKVHSGFLSLYTSSESSTSKFGLESCREQLISEVTRIINMYKCEEMSISIAGHSMGSSLGLLFAYDLAELELNKYGLNRVIPITVFSFAGPRVGNLLFKARCEELGVKVLRIVNVNDPITKMPGYLFNENCRVLLGGKTYAHVGVELAIDFFEMHNPSCVHDLECYIRLLRIHKRSVRDQFKKNEDEAEGFDFIGRAREFLSSAQYADISSWRDSVCNVIHLVQSLRTYFFFYLL